MNLSELIFLSNELKTNINILKDIIKYETKLISIIDKEKQIYDNNFWINNTKDKSNILKNIQKEKNIIDLIKNFDNEYNELKIFIYLLEQENNQKTFSDCLTKAKILNNQIKLIIIENLFTIEDDKNAILSINAGAGGNDSQDWVAILLRMYTRWSEKHKFNIKLVESVTIDNIGFRNITILIEGKYAYGYLKSENGIHRLIRISPFDNSNKRHTSFAAVEIIPEIKESSFTKIKNDEIKIDTFRAGGAGGQHVNKTETAVRITHIKTGLVVTCQNERSQHQNKELAIKILSSKVFEINKIDNRKKIDDIRENHKKIEWGNHIRSYVFMPYTLVKDSRINYETGNIHSILDGNIDNLIFAYLKSQKKLT